MTLAQPYRLTALAGLALALMGLVGCALDSESEVRAQLATWVNLGETHYFDSSMGCTAGLFAVEDTRLRSFITKVRSVDSGLKAIEEDKTVAFDIAGQSPSLVSEAVMTADLPKGLGLLSSGVAAKDCMKDGLKRAYLTTLNSAQAVMIYDAKTNAVAILDRINKRVFFARGDV